MLSRTQKRMVWRRTAFTRFDLSRDGAVWAGTLNAGVTRIKNGKFVTNYNTVERTDFKHDCVHPRESRRYDVVLQLRKWLERHSQNNHWQLVFRQRWITVRVTSIASFRIRACTLWIGTASGLAALRSMDICIPARVPDVPA